MELEELFEELTVVEYIPFRTFKEKINITKKHLGKGKIVIDERHVYIERKERGIISEF
ncbi:hypothetical protein [Tissierella sp. P1]|uniref:hypothetical protein n=1 Tax=Tissierella sp. P1 TaxID=1280483 RepID=UPI001302F6C6|nr:hypothetical protein [Tissierella sp. P1]